MIELRGYRKGDYDAITDPKEPVSCDFDSISHLGVNLTCTKDDKPIACGGVMINGETGEAWVRMSQEFAGRSILMYRMIKKGLEIIDSNFSLDRVISRVNNNFDAGKRFVKHLGFSDTGELLDISNSTYRTYELWQTQ